MKLPYWLRFDRTTTCERCGLRYAEREPACPRCADLSDAQVDELLAQRAREQEGGQQLGTGMLIAAGLGLVLLLIVIL